MKVRRTDDGTGWIVVDDQDRQVSPPAPKFWPNRRRAKIELMNLVAAGSGGEEGS